MQCMASSATVVEIKAGLILMEWAIKEKLRGICIKTDCLTFVQGLKDPNSVPFALRSVLFYFHFLCSMFSYVEVVKVSRLVVKAAHDMARAALPRL